MTEYIERQELERRIHTGMNIIEVMQTIIDIPPTDVRPVVRGEWSVAIGYDPKRYCLCSVCQRMNYEPSNYCPNCGAVMNIPENKKEENQ